MEPKKKRTRSDGFTPTQRQWILDRDHRQCVLCGSDEELHVHHMSPWRWSSTVLRWTQERTNSFWNGISLCAQCHTKGNSAIHSDIARASSSYKDDKGIYNKVFAARDGLCRQHMEYWTIAHDEKMVLIAMYNSVEYISKGNYPTPWKQQIDRVLDDQKVILWDGVVPEKEIKPEVVESKPAIKDVSVLTPNFNGSMLQYLARNK